MSEQETEEEKASLWPKTGSEYGYLAMDMGVIGMIVAATQGECPIIKGIRAFVYSFAVVSIITGLIKFALSLRRPGQEAKFPKVKEVLDFLGLAQLALGIWGIAIIFPHLTLFSNPSPETCMLSPLIAGFIPSAIIAIVILVMLGYLCAWMVTGCRTDTFGQDDDDEKGNNDEQYEDSAEP